MRFLLLFLLLAVPGISNASSQTPTNTKPYSLQRLADYLAVDPFGFNPKPSDKGWLIVYTDTEQYNDGQILYNPHTGYQILDLNGKLLKKVPNHVTRNDEIPTAVSLNPGFYLLATPWKKTLVELKTGYITTARLFSEN